MSSVPPFPCCRLYFMASPACRGSTLLNLVWLTVPGQHGRHAPAALTGASGQGDRAQPKWPIWGLLTYISKVVPTHLLEKQTHSLWLLLPSALTALQDEPIKWLSGQFPFSPLPFSSFCILRCDRWERLSPDRSCFPRWDRHQRRPKLLSEETSPDVCVHLASAELRTPPQQVPPRPGAGTSGGDGEAPGSVR